MAFLVVTVVRKPQTTQMRHGQRLGRAPLKDEGAGLHFAIGGISNANNSRMPAPTCAFSTPLPKSALQLTAPLPAAGPPVVGAAAPRSLISSLA